jgi:hypothetical protein
VLEAKMLVLEWLSAVIMLMVRGKPQPMAWAQHECGLKKDCDMERNMKNKYSVSIYTVF